MTKADRELLRRLLLSAHRQLDYDHQLFNEVVCWLLDNLPAIRADFDEVMLDIEFRSGLGSLDDRICATLKRHGQSADRLDATRRRYHRWRESWSYMDPDFSCLLWEVFRRLLPPPAIGSPNEELRANYTEAELNDWYV